MKYSDKLKDPRWQKKRLEIFERDGWKCAFCDDKSETLHVHHLIYQHGKEPWECHEDNLLTLCANCHQAEFELRKESEAEFLEFLKIYHFSASDVHELMSIMGRVMDRGKDVPSKIIRLMEKGIDSFYKNKDK